MKNEIEAKFLSINKDSMRIKLKSVGFRLKTPEYMMRRKTFTFPHATPGRKKWGRVRQEANKVTMAVKEIRGSGINDTYEVELTVSDFDMATKLFEVCGIKEQAFQENMREVWTRNGVEVTIDTWPGLNPFMEIEGVSEKIVQELSNELGYDFGKAIFGSIDLVYERELNISSEAIINLPEITFTNPPKKNAMV